MLRIRRLYDDVLPVNRERLRQVKEILRVHFPAVSPEEVEQIGEKLRNPFKHRFRSILFVAENLRSRVQGFALVLHEPVVGFCYLDWIAIAGSRVGGGVGGALYDQVRSEAAALKVKGLFFECLPDDPEACPVESLLRENRARLRFYERYGARPVVNTSYEAPVKPGDTCMPHLVYDGLDREPAPQRAFAKKAVRAVLERKYAEQCPPDYVEKVVGSFRDDPVRLREFRYVKPQAVRTRVQGRSIDQIALVVNDRHTIHHVHERGYVESPVRVSGILRELDKTGFFAAAAPHSFPDKYMFAVHDRDFVHYLERACRDVPENQSLYPYVFPIRNKARPPKEPSVLAGYYCIDTFTPINRNAFPAARRGVDCALTAARELLQGKRIAYALVRPPGHHAERRAFGGFCYLNNAAIAAQYLTGYGRAAILDIDYHHGNGQQDIFYSRSDVLTVSIHGHPRFAYPYFSGFEEERGEGEGEGFNLNIPLRESVDGTAYTSALASALKRIEQFAPHFLVVALGLDTAKGDPTGTWSLLAKDFKNNGRMIGESGLPVLVLQEGGYRTHSLGMNARSFFEGLTQGSLRGSEKRQPERDRLHGMALRDQLNPRDAERIERLLSLSGFFKPGEVESALKRVGDRLSRGPESPYAFVLAEHYGRLVGVIGYGPIEDTVSSFQIHVAAVLPDFQGRKVGRRLVRECERRIKAAGGMRVYAETPQRVQYASTRAFYEHCGYHLQSLLEDFYAAGEAKAIYVRSL